MQNVLDATGNRARLLLVTGLALVLGLALHAGPASGFDHQLFDQTLAEFVDQDGLVDYAGLKRNRSTLDTYLSRLGDVSPSQYESWSEAEKIAFWINAYNGFTLKAILDHYPIKSSFFTSLVYPRNSIRQIDGVWDELKFEVRGERLTLDHIEHQILRRDFAEPRIHMALVCAALSCPPLRREAYTGDHLDQQLEDQSRRFLARSENFSVKAGGKTVQLSAIFDWFGPDFVARYGTGASFQDRSPEVRAVLSFAWPFLSPQQRQVLEKGDFRIRYSDYDWTLNQQQ